MEIVDGDTARKAPISGAVACLSANRRNQLSFAVIFMIVNLHTLRFALGLAYLLSYVVTTAFALASFFGTRKYLRLIDRGRSVVVWCGIAVVTSIITLITTSVGGAVTGLSRFLFAVPVFLAIVAFTDSRQDLRSHLSVMVAFYTVGALTVPFQEIVGPIDWLTDTLIRGGFDRYGSLLGAVSIVAIAAGMIVQMIGESSLRARWFFFMSLSGSALVTLSKAAFLSVAFGVTAYIFFARQSIMRRTATVLLALAAGVLAFALNPSLQERFDVVGSEYGISLTGEEVINYDVGTLQSARDRLTSLPLENYVALNTFHTPLVYLIGGGYGMGGQTLVAEADSRAPQGHNQYVELVTVFGPVLALVLVGITVRVAFRLLRKFRKSGDTLFRSFFLIMVFFLVGAAFGGGMYFHPVTASMWWASMFIAFVEPQFVMVSVDEFRARSVSVAQRHERVNMQFDRGCDVDIRPGQ